METYICLLRGINVGAHKRIKMIDLVDCLKHLAFSNIKTYLQSGNIIFSTEKAHINQLEKSIFKAIEVTFGFEVSVFIINSEDLKSILNNNPFTIDKSNAIENIHITFLATEPNTEFVEKTSAFNCLPDEFKLSNKAIYIYCHNGYGKTKLTNNFFENKLKVIATTRNLKTCNELLAMATL